MSFTANAGPVPAASRAPLFGNKHHAHTVEGAISKGPALSRQFDTDTVVITGGTAAERNAAAAEERNRRGEYAQSMAESITTPDGKAHLVLQLAHGMNSRFRSAREAMRDWGRSLRNLDAENESREFKAMDDARSQAMGWILSR